MPTIVVSAPAGAIGRGFNFDVESHAMPAIPAEAIAIGMEAYTTLTNPLDLVTLGPLGLDTPSLTIPAGLSYSVDLRKGRRWNTVVTPSATGRRSQRRSLIPVPKKTYRLTVMCVSPITGNADQALFTAVRTFEAQVMGRFKPFYIFDPHGLDFNYSVSVTVVSGIPTNLPITLPFKGGTYTPHPPKGAVVFSESGPNGETRLISWDASGYVTGTYIWPIGVVNGQVRVLVTKTHDSDDWAFNFNLAEPPAQITMDVEEYLG